MSTSESRSDGPFLVDLPELADPADLSARMSAYQNYLSRMVDRFPANAHAFAIAPWHYNPEAHECPHDSWVQQIAIRETGAGQRGERRRIDLVAHLLGAYHDGIACLTYSSVAEYEFTGPRFSPQRLRVGHGDWLVDEVTLAPGGLVKHVVNFSSQARWSITCVDIEWRWVLLPTGPRRAFP